MEELKQDLINDNNHRRGEYADCFLLLFGAAYSDGLIYEDILFCIREKLEICKNRKWGLPDENGVVNHV